MARHRRLRGQSLACTVDEEELERVQSTLGSRLPNEMVAFLAATERSLGELVTLTQEAVDAVGLPKRWLAFAYDRDARTYHCIERTTVVGAPCRVVFFTVGEAPKRKRVEMGFPEYLQQALPLPPETRKPTRARRASVDEDDEVDDFDEIDEGASDRDRPQLVVHLNPRRSIVGKRVRHRVYGEGSVVDERRDGKHAFEIEFPGVGRKVLLSSFVEIVDGGADSTQRASAH